MQNIFFESEIGTALALAKQTRRIYEIFEDWTMKFRKKDEAEMGFATG